MTTPNDDSAKYFTPQHVAGTRAGAEGWQNVPGPGDALQSCRTCLYRPQQDCMYPIPEWMNDLLHQLYQNAFPTERRFPTTMQDDDGLDCPTWKRKP